MWAHKIVENFKIYSTVVTNNKDKLKEDGKPTKIQNVINVKNFQFT